MTKEYYQNLRLSIRNYIRELDTSLTWYLDEINENITADTFGNVKTSTSGYEDDIKPYFRDMINVNVFSRDSETAEEKIGTLIEALQGRNIPIRDYLNYDGETTPELLDNILIERIEITNIGNTEGYYQTNLGIYYQQIGE